jgi:hypothetical protein
MLIISYLDNTIDLSLLDIFLYKNNRMRTKETQSMETWSFSHEKLFNLYVQLSISDCFSRLDFNKFIVIIHESRNKKREEICFVQTLILSVRDICGDLQAQSAAAV